MTDKLQRLTWKKHLQEILPDLEKEKSESKLLLGQGIDSQVRQFHQNEYDRACAMVYAVKKAINSIR